MRFGDRLKEDCGYDPQTTNNKMELKAVIEALTFLSTRLRSAAARSESDPSAASLEWLSSPILVYTDSQYVKNGVSAWLRNWKQRGWKTADKKPVKNQELWMELDELVQELAPSFFWVEGHAGDPDNERCDSMVREAMKTKRNER